MEKVGDKATARRPDAARPACRCCRARSSRSATVDEAQEIADEIGYPVIIKAVAGGGGRGMNVVCAAGGPRAASTRRRARPRRRCSRTAPSTSSATSQAPRHTEVQIVCDEHGNGVYLGERDCSVQRRHQKLIEEAPSIHLDARDAARRSARRRSRGALSVGYTGAGTMEFLLDQRGQLRLHGDERAHPGRAPGQRDDHRRRPDPGADPRRRRRAALGRRRTTSSLRGHAIECRINAEDPDRDFAPDRRAGSTPTSRPAGRGRAWTRTATPAGRSARSTTR